MSADVLNVLVGAGAAAVAIVLGFALGRKRLP